MRLEYILVMRNRPLSAFNPDQKNNSDRSQNAVLAMRRKAVTSLSVAMLVLAAIAFPFTLFAWMSGYAGPVVISVLGLGTGAFALSAARNGRTNAAIRAQSTYIIASGVLLSILEPALVDFGLSQLFLGIIHMALFREKQSSRTTIWLMAGIAAFAGLSAVGLSGMGADDVTPLTIAGMLNCVVIIAGLAYFTIRLHRVAKLHSRSHKNAINHLLDHMGDGYVRFSHGAHLVFSSPGARKLLGAQTYELAGEGFSERVHVADRPVFYKEFSDAVHTQNTKTMVVRLRRDDVERRARPPEFIWVELYLSPVSDAAIKRDEWEVVALLRDVTARKERELEMETARDAAEEASQTKSRFLATIGHELRTPLNAIVGFSDMMVNGIGGTLHPTHQEYAELIKQSGHHLLDVVNMLLDMSRIEAGKFELQPSGFEPDKLAEPCLRMVQPCADERNISLVSEIAASMPTLMADERACRQILINLLSNAVKFSSKDSEVKLRMWRQGQKIALSVSDNGIGMSKEATSRIGEPFFQAHEELNRKYEGTGLGLSIVKGLVDLHQGVLRINSTLGEGTTITVLLPIHGPEIDENATGTVFTLHKPSSEPEQNSWPEQKRIAR